jgi:hypothetical protein
LNKWDFSRVFQGVGKPIRRLRKSAIRLPVPAREIRIPHPAAAGRGGRVPLEMADRERPARAFSSEVETGSRKENASKQESRAPFRFNRNGKGSRDVSTAVLHPRWRAVSDSRGLGMSAERLAPLARAWIGLICLSLQTDIDRILTACAPSR